MGTKQCRVCGLEKPLSEEFWHRRATSPDGFRNDCRACVQTRQAAYNQSEERKKARYDRESVLRQTDPEWAAKQNAVVKDWRARQAPEQRREYSAQPHVKARIKREQRENYERHQAERREYRRRQWEDPAYREKVAAWARARYADPQKRLEIREKYSRWYQENAEVQRPKQLLSEHKRRALKANAEGAFTLEDLHDILEVQDGVCFYCDTDISKGYTVDHFIPLSKKGSNWPSNLRLSCGPCNFSKGDKLPSEFTPKVKRY
jgi:5-methylcytosine-specific restriction endonuclease McrA